MEQTTVALKTTTDELVAALRLAITELDADTPVREEIVRRGEAAIKRALSQPQIQYNYWAEDSNQNVYAI